MPGDDDDLGLPDHLRERPRNKLFWGRPTAWLLGTQLVASLRDIMLSSVYDFDPRDWMAPGPPIDLQAAIRAADGAEPEGAWIDFLADTGDSPRLVYRLAYLLQQPALAVIDERGKPLPRRLPRGAALVIGGDTAYPVADHDTLIARVRAPFLWARQQLAADGRLDDTAIPLLGIPGNHDYYNVLHGYVRQFRVPAPPNPTPGVVPPPPRLDLPGYLTAQQASYFALLLPYGWQLWGLDVEMKQLDERQRAYFLELAAARPTTSRIVVTSQPTRVYHAPSERCDELAAIFDALALPPAFTDERDGVLPPEQVRLDLSGDVHTYERYWGDDGDPDGERERTGNDLFAHPVTGKRTNYASVVSGLGGAFHHPAQVRFGERAPRAAWPAPDESARAIGDRLVRPRKLFQAGAVGVAGGAIAAFLYWLVALADGALDPARARRPSILDAPFATDGLSGELQDRLFNLLMTAAVIGSVAGMGFLIWGCVKAMRALARPIDRGAPRGWWARATYRLSHARFTYWCLRWIGGERRRTWRTLITAPVWLPILVPALLLYPYALYKWPHLERTADGFAPLYAIVVVLLVAGLLMGLLVGGARHGLIARVVLGLFGLAIAALIVWTWYGWTVMIVQRNLRSLWTLAFFALWAARRLLVASGVLGKGPIVRRLTALAGFAVLVIACVAIPLHAVDAGLPFDLSTTRPALPMWALPIAALLGGYFACLWVGWYFLVCLQFNAHGNEAGGAARITSYAEFLRIKLTPGAAEVWVISADGPRPAFGRTTDDHPIRARVVDHFTVRRG